MASNYYLGSPGFSPGYSPGYSQYSAQQSAGQWTPSFREDFHPSRPPISSRPSKSSLEPLIYDYGPNPEYQDPPKRSFSLSAFILNWWLCILSILTSIGAMAAITIILILVDDKTIPKLPFNITVNTYVSCFATISKASMLVAVAESISQLKWLWFRQPRTLHDIQIYDDASRGSMGALRLMSKTRGVQLAALGAAITILSIAMEPFVQQIVLYPSRPVEAGKASVGRAQAYDAELALETLNSGLLVGPEWGMKAAIYDGIFKPKSVENLIPACYTGNCTFPLFDSLAFCSKCLDVTQDVVLNNPQNNSYTLGGRQDVSYTIPGGGIVEFSVLFEEGNLAMGPSIVSTTVLPETLSKEVLDLQDPLLTFAVLQFPNVQQQIRNGNYYTSLPVTHECSIYFCVNTYNVTVVNSVVNTTVVSSWTSDTGTPTFGGALQVNGMEGTVDAVLEQPNNYMKGNDTYRIPAGSLANLKAWLNATIQGSMNTSFSKVERKMWVNDELQALNGTSDWSGLIGALATAMTTYIRSPIHANSVNLVEGVAHKTEMFVQVKWMWLGLPAGLVGMSTIFLVATMIKNESKGALAWKSSSLALLFHGLEGVSKGTGERLMQMRRVAMSTRVCLGRGEDGEWKLINAE